MIVTFCGHSQFYETNKYVNQFLEILEQEIGDSETEMYLGGYGGFDSFCYACCKEYQKSHPSVRLIYVTPYLKTDPIYEKNYDSVIYPGLEDKPQRFAISYRNKFMVDKADIVIAYINHNWGGAYNTYTYAKKKGKRVINIAEKE